MDQALVDATAYAPGRRRVHSPDGSTFTHEMISTPPVNVYLLEE